jgi:hypothetical protein
MTPLDHSMRRRSRSAAGSVFWASLPQGLLEQLLALLPLRSVATAARTCKAWAPAARVVRLRAQLGEALLEPEEVIWRRYSGGAGRMVREGYNRFVVEVCGWKEGEMTDGDWERNATNCGGSASKGIDRAGFFRGEYVIDGRDAAADAYALTDEAAMCALVAEAKAYGPALRNLWQALEARLAEAALMRPLWTASAPQLVDLLVAQKGTVDTARRCCCQLQQRLVQLDNQVSQNG